MMDSSGDNDENALENETATGKRYAPLPENTIRVLSLESERVSIGLLRIMYDELSEWQWIPADVVQHRHAKDFDYERLQLRAVHPSRYKYSIA